MQNIMCLDHFWKCKYIWLTKNLLFAFFELTSWFASPLNTHGVPNESKKELKLKVVAVAIVVGVVVKLLKLLLLQIS